jgi:glycosyltransferase involved in cell wall biosynthesis
LTIIQSTHASLGGFKATGLFERHVRLLQEYAKTFDVVVYSSDTVNYSAALGVVHKPVPWLPNAFGWRHLVYYLWLVAQAPRMRGVIKVIGSNIPTLALVRLLSRRPMMVTYQLNYAEAMRGSEKSLFKRVVGPRLERLALMPADLVLVTTVWLGEKVKKVYRKPIVLLPNWVDLSPVDLAGSGIQRDENLILYAGRLHWLKGINVLIDAFAQVKCSHPQARLLICGAGEEADNLQNQVKSLAVTDVEFRGRVPNSQVLQLMRSAAIAVLPTLTMEGHPKSLIEAMACGVACVATEVPGNREVITRGRNGLLTPAGDVEALVNTISTLLDDPELRNKLGQNAQRDAQQLSFDVIVPKEIRTLLALGEYSA